MKTNSLVYKTTRKAKNGETFVISIRLNDECKNGHQDFSITGTIYEANKPLIEKYMISGGAIGDKIALHFPEFAIFDKLHCCDFNGYPMYTVGNGFYFLREGFNKEKPSDANFKAKYCEYYRLKPEQFDVLATSENELEYSILLHELGILKQWNEEAKIAIMQLERLTGNEFVIDSTKSNFINVPLEQIEEFKAKKAAGYYSQENKEARAKETKELALNKKIDSIKEEYKAKNKALKLEYDLKLSFTRSGVPSFNWIHYTHDNKIIFNWKHSDKQIDEALARKAVKDASKILNSHGIKCFLGDILL